MQRFSNAQTWWLWTVFPNASNRGETYQVIKATQITSEKLIELGNVISGKPSGRTSDTQITVADLTGVAVQDIKIAEAVYTASL